uniref:Nascent polypeptide-associated complex subunit alpha-like UBA domain-containing protein n=1 Tax=Chaetoceros debilis TaxID=122233 RepID=A0A7S3PZN2_9STRA
MTAQDEAKQLDSVTDRVTEEESTMDASAAKSKVLSLSSDVHTGMDSAAEEKSKSAKKALAAIEVSKEDIDVLVEELEISEDVADKALREVLFEGGGIVTVTDGGEGAGASPSPSPLGEALRRLIRS